MTTTIIFNDIVVKIEISDKYCRNSGIQTLCISRRGLVENVTVECIEVIHK